MGQKVVEDSNNSYENEIRRVHRPSNDDFKSITFCQGGPNFGEERPEIVEKIGKNREIYCYANKGVVNSNRENWPLLPGIKIFALLWFSHMLDHIICHKLKKSVFRKNFSVTLWPSPP